MGFSYLKAKKDLNNGKTLHVETRKDGTKALVIRCNNKTPGGGVISLKAIWRPPTPKKTERRPQSPNGSPTRDWQEVNGVMS